MLRETVNKLINSRMFLIVVSIILAIMLWIYVVNVENTNMEVNIRDIPVTFIGDDDILADRELVVTESNPQKVSIKLLGRRSAVQKLTKDDISITVDLTDITTAGTVYRVYDIELPSHVDDGTTYILEKSAEYISVTVDRLSSKQIEVHGELNGNVAEGYMAGTMEFSPEIITVSGPEDEIAKIDSAFVSLQRENISKTVVTTASYTLLDEDGNEVKSESITAEPETVTVTLPVNMVKTVGLSVKLIAGGGATEDNTLVDIDPPEITLTGPASVLESINQLSLGQIDLAKVVSSASETFKIVLPNDVSTLSGETEATVTVSIRGLTTKRLTVSNIEFANNSEGYIATPVTQSVDVLIRGPAEIIELIDEHSIRVVGDLTDLGETTGNYLVDATVFIDGYSEAGAVGEYSVVVNLTEE